MYQKFYETQMSFKQKVSTFLAEIETLVKQTKDMGKNVSEVAVILKILNSLPSTFAVLITSWDLVYPAKQSLSDPTERLLKEEQRMIVLELNEDNLALQIQSLKIKPSQKGKKSNILELKQKTKCSLLIS